MLRAAEAMIDVASEVNEHKRRRDLGSRSTSTIPYVLQPFTRSVRNLQYLCNPYSTSTYASLLLDAKLIYLSICTASSTVEYSRVLVH